MEQTVDKAVDRLSELLDLATKTVDRASKTAKDLEVKDRLTDAVSALRRTRVTQDDDSGIERFMTGMLLGVAVGFGLALLLAPKTGEEMRDDLMQRGIELRDRAGELASKMPFGDGEQLRAEKATTDQPGRTDTTARATSSGCIVLNPASRNVPGRIPRSTSPWRGTSACPVRGRAPAASRGSKVRRHGRRPVRRR